MTEQPPAQFGEALSRRQHWLRAALTAGPGVLWMIVFLLVPLLGILIISFTAHSVYGQLQWTFSVESYKRFFGFGPLGFELIYPRILLHSLVLAAGTTAFCIAAGLPLALFIAALPMRFKQIGLIGMVIPFWTNLLVRTYAWQILLSGDSWLAKAAVGLGLLHPGEPLYPSSFAVFLGLTCDYLPFLVLPLYASVEKIDWSIAEAASDLGAHGWQVFRHALLPQITPGLVAGTVLVFVPATGQFVIPDLLGGGKSILLGSAIQQQFGPSRDWPFGSAIACLSMVIVMVGLWLYMRAAERDSSQ